MSSFAFSGDADATNGPDSGNDLAPITDGSRSQYSIATNNSIDAEIDSHASGDQLNLPDPIYKSVMALWSKLSGNPDLQNQFFSATIIFSDQINPGVIAVASYPKQAIVFFSAALDLSPDELLFATAHDFGHLQSSNWQIVQSMSIGQFLSGPNPAELNANAFARSILNLSVNPAKFANYGFGL